MDRSRFKKLINARSRGTEEKEGARILPFRHGININIGLVIFLFIFLYLVYSLIHFAARESYTTFQVAMPGPLSEDTSYQAVILRQEAVTVAEHAGYVDLYVQEGGRVSVGVDIASVDEVGTFSAQIREAMTERQLTREEQLRLKTALKELSQSYRGMNFSAVYEKKSMLRSAVLDNDVSDLYGEVLAGTAAADFFHVSECRETGIVAYYRDGYESKTLKDLTAADLDTAGYSRQTTADLVSAGDFLYKTVTSEQWSLGILLTAEEAAEYGKVSSLGVTFLKNGLKTAAAASVVTGTDGSYFLKLDLSRYMIQFVSDRFTMVRIRRSEEDGYKLPKTALTKESFYMIPRAYLTEAGFIEANYDEGRENVRTMKADIVFEDEKYYYVAQTAFKSGTILAKPESDERYTVRLTADLDGVYKISKGFTEFCPVVIIDESDDYVLSAQNVRNGVSAYDTILLNAAGYTSGQILQ